MASVHVDIIQLETTVSAARLSTMTNHGKLLMALQGRPMSVRVSDGAREANEVAEHSMLLYLENGFTLINHTQPFTCTCMMNKRAALRS